MTTKMNNTEIRDLYFEYALYINNEVKKAETEPEAYLDEETYPYPFIAVFWEWLNVIHHETCNNNSCYCQDQAPSVEEAILTVAIRNQKKPSLFQYLFG